MIHIPLYNPGFITRPLQEHVITPVKNRATLLHYFINGKLPIDTQWHDITYTHNYFENVDDEFIMKPVVNTIQIKIKVKSINKTAPKFYFD